MYLLNNNAFGYNQVSNACIRRGFELAPLALTGPGQDPTVMVGEGDAPKGKAQNMCDMM
jgi:hypothetical protein